MGGFCIGEGLILNGQTRGKGAKLLIVKSYEGGTGIWVLITETACERASLSLVMVKSRLLLIFDYLTDTMEWMQGKLDVVSCNCLLFLR